MLVPGERAELLDACLHVVKGHPLPGGDAGQIHPVEHGLVGLDHAVGHRHPELALRPQHREPQPALGTYLLLRRRDRVRRNAGPGRSGSVRRSPRHSRPGHGLTVSAGSSAIALTWSMVITSGPGSGAMSNRLFFRSTEM